MGTAKMNFGVNADVSSGSVSNTSVSVSVSVSTTSQGSGMSDVSVVAEGNNISGTAMLLSNELTGTFEEKLEQRLMFLKMLAERLKYVYKALGDAGVEIDHASADFFMEVYNDELKCIQPEIDKYNANIAQIKMLNKKVLEETNEWYTFVKDSEKMLSLSYPFVFRSKKRSMNRLIASTNQKVSDLMIENRLLGSKINQWQAGLSEKAISRIHDSSAYSEYDTLLKERKKLADDIRYLCGQFPELFPVSIGPSGIEKLIERFS